MHRTYRILAGMVFLFAMLMTGGRAFAQGGATGAISGVVVDGSGGAVADAEVQIIDAKTDQIARKVPSGTDGTFVVTLLPPGTYSVVVNKTGFAEAKSADIEVRVTETTRITIPLKPGAVTETVEITAQVTNVDTSNPTTGQSITANTVRTLPLASQNFQQLLTLSAGAQSNLNNSTQLGRGDVRINVNGQREDNNNYLIEGISATDYNVAELANTPLPSPDAIQEFKVATSLYDAKSRERNGGGKHQCGAQVWNPELSTATRTEFFRNDVLDANDFFLNASSQPKPPLQQKHFWRQPGRSGGNGKTGIFLCELSGHAAKERRLLGHDYFHVYSVHSGGGSLFRGGDSGGLRSSEHRSGGFGSVTDKEHAVRRGCGRIPLSRPDGAGRHNTLQYRAVCHQQPGQLQRQPVHRDVGQGIQQRRRQAWRAHVLFQLADV